MHKGVRKKGHYDRFQNKCFNLNLCKVLIAIGKLSRNNSNINSNSISKETGLPRKTTINYIKFLKKSGTLYKEGSIYRFTGTFGIKTQINEIYENLNNFKSSASIPNSIKQDIICISLPRRLLSIIENDKIVQIIRDSVENNIKDEKGMIVYIIDYARDRKISTKYFVKKSDKEIGKRKLTENEAKKRYRTFMKMKSKKK